MAEKKEGVLEDICEGIGTVAGGMLGNAPGVVLGVYHALDRAVGRRESINGLIPLKRVRKRELASDGSTDQV